MVAKFRELKQRRRRRQRERQKRKNKQNNNFACALHLFVHFLAIVAGLNNFTRPLYGVGEHNTTRTFPFLFKKRIIDPNDPQLRWILWIISKTWYFAYMIRGVSLLRIRKEWIQPAVTWNNFSSLRPFLNSRHGVNDRFYPFYRDGKIAIQTGPALF